MNIFSTSIFNSDHYIKKFLYKILLITSFILMFYFLSIDKAYATECNLACTSAFSNAIQTHGTDPGDIIDFDCHSYVTGDITGTFSTIGVTNPNCENTCPNGNCVATGQPIKTIDVGEFQLSSSTNDLTINNLTTIGQDQVNEYKNVVVSNNQILTFSALESGTIYKLKSLSLGQNSVVNMPAGDYWIEDLTFSQNSSLNIVGVGTVRLYVKNSFEIENNSVMSQSSKQFFIYGYDNITLANNSATSAFIYSEKVITLSQNSTITGAIAAKNVKLDEHAVVNYDSLGLLDLDVGTYCLGYPLIDFDVEMSSFGVNCISSDVTLSANQCGNPAVDYVEKIILDTGTGKGTWSLVEGNGTFSDITSNDGLAEYTFNSQDLGVAKFSLLYSEGNESVEVVATQEGDISRIGRASIEILPSNFMITSSPLPNPPSGNVSSFAAIQTAGVSDTLYLTAYGQSSSDPVCGVIEAYTGPKVLKFWQDYVDPATGTLVSTIDNYPIANSEASATGQVVNFVLGQAVVDVKYRDVGKIKINVKDDTWSTAVESAGNVSEEVQNILSAIKGSTSNFVVKPAKFILAIPSNPGAVDQNGGVFIAAGENFTVNVDVTDIDNNITPNYGKELVPEQISISSSTLVAPIDGRNGSLNNGAINNATSFSSYSPGRFTSNTLSFDEVGIIKLTAGVAGGNYLGAGNASGPESSNVGRFIPSYFGVNGNVPQLSTACSSGGFTYLDQPFTYNVAPNIAVTAFEKNGGITQNYKGAYWKINPLSVVPLYSSNSTIAPFFTANAESDITFVDNNNGTGEYTFGDGGGLKFNRVNGTNIAGFSAEIKIDINISDTDGVSYPTNPYSFGGTNVGQGIGFSTGNTFYHGRITLGNTLGSELLSLTMPLAVEYWNGTSFVTNTYDNCTSFTNPSNISITPNPNNLSSTPSLGVFNNGFGEINLGIPSPSGITGYVDLELGLTNVGVDLPYLQYDWLNDGVADGLFDDNPRARGTFGLYRGTDDVVYIREKN